MPKSAADFVACYSLPLTVSAPGPKTRRSGEPVTLGLPFPKGMLTGADSLVLQRATERVPVQTRALAHWSDDSIQWLLIDFRADTTPDMSTKYLLTKDADARYAAQAPSRLQVVHDEHTVVVDTGVARFSFRDGDNFPFGDITVSGRKQLDESRSGLEIAPAQGQQWRPRIGQLRIEESGPVRAVLFVGAETGVADDARVRPFARLHFFEGLATVRVELTLHNPRRALHRGGYWDLGDPGSVLIRDVSLVFALAVDAGPERVRCSPESGSHLMQVLPPLEVYQDSSGGENWRSTNHVNRHRVVPHSFRGYRLRTPDGQTSGLRATPIVTVERDGRFLGVAAQYFWQNFPKAIEAVERLDHLTSVPSAVC